MIKFIAIIGKSLCGHSDVIYARMTDQMCVKNTTPKTIKLRNSL